MPGQTVFNKFHNILLLFSYLKHVAPVQKFILAWNILTVDIKINILNLFPRKFLEVGKYVFK